LIIPEENKKSEYHIFVNIFPAYFSYAATEYGFGQRGRFKPS
jgi:hypothetical protein